MRDLVRGALIIAVAAAVAVWVGVACDPPDPHAPKASPAWTPTPTPPPAPVRWGLARELGVDPSSEKRINRRDEMSAPLACRAVDTKIESYFAPGQIPETTETASVGVGDVEVRHTVVWIGNGASTSAIAKRFISELDACTPAEFGSREWETVVTFERTGSVEEGRFGWYESTRDVPGWGDAAEPEPLHGKVFQSAGSYVFVDGWVLLGVEILTEQTDTDVRSEVDLEGLLDVLVAEYEADPLTFDDWKNDHYGRERIRPSPAPSPSESAETAEPAEATG